MPQPSAPAPAAADRDVVVATSRGSVRGRWRGSSAAFLGIPFAQPPVGDLRFEAPVPPEPWSGIRDATRHGPTAQRSVDGVTLIPEPSVPGDATLNVDVYSPAPDRDAALPVLVYIHGGGFVSGSPASPWYDGASFNRDGVVTVSISYRLGFDGFGEIDGAPSNRAVLDWIAALEWVRDEIAAFGGDPRAVTIVGQSAGAGAVVTLVSMPRAAGLFRSAIAISPAVGDIPLDRARALSSRLAALAGVDPTRAGFASVDEATLLGLQEKAGQHTGGGRLAGIVSLLDDGLPWGPVVDGDLIPRSSIDGIRAGHGADVALVIGSADDEVTMATKDAGAVLRLIPAGFGLARLGLDRHRRRAYLAGLADSRRRGTAAILGGYASDRVFRSTVLRVLRARGDAPTWAYRFAWPSPTIGWACHCLDVPFWFDLLDADRVDAIAGDAPPRSLAHALHGSAVEFAREGSPGWDPWSGQSGRTRVFGGPSGGPDVVDDGYAGVAALL